MDAKQILEKVNRARCGDCLVEVEIDDELEDTTTLDEAQGIAGALFDADGDCGGGRCCPNLLIAEENPVFEDEGVNDDARIQRIGGLNPGVSYEYEIDDELIERVTA